MSTTILDQARATEANRRAALLREYRALLATNEPKDASRLLELTRQLDFSIGRMKRDAEAIKTALRLEEKASGKEAAQAELETAFEAAKKHREAMAKKVKRLKEAQAELDGKESSARGSLSRKENAQRERDELLAAHSDLFADVIEEETRAEREAAEKALRDAAEAVPKVREEIEAAEAELEEAEKKLDEAAHEAGLVRTHHNDDKAEEKFKARDDAQEAVYAIERRLHSLRDRLEEAEEARRQLNSDEDE